jgi:hypothetical protein
LPPGTEVSLKDGLVKVKVEAGLSSHPEGGRSARLVVSGFDYRDGPQGAPFVRFDAFRVVASRLDAPRIAIDEIALEGLEAETRRTPDGAIAALGMLVRPAPASPAAPPAVPPAPPVDAAVPAPSAPQTPAAMAARLSQTRPLVSLAKLDINLKRLSFVDESREGAAPLAASVRVYNMEPIELLGEDPEGRAPARIQVDAAAPPILDSFACLLELIPFAGRPVFRATIGGKGLHGEGLTAVGPELKALLDGAELTDGRFKAKVEGLLRVQRHGPLDFNLSNGFGFEIVATGMELKIVDDGPVLAGLDELHIDATKIEPATGGVHVKAIELTKPKGLVTKENDGLHVLGFVVKLPPKAQPASESGAPPQVPAPTAEPSAPNPPAQVGPELAAASPASPAAEIRIDKFAVSGIDFTYRDNDSKPPALVPLTGLDVEVQNLTSRILTEPEAVRFSAVVKAGKVPLSKGSKENAEQRELFEEVTASGRVALVPTISGWVKLGVSALALTGFKGPAAAAGVTIEDGVFDSHVDIRFHDDGSLEVQPAFTVTDLGLSETANGPIYSALKLPAPVDTVLFVVRDEEGAIKMRPNFRMENVSTVSAGEIASVAAATIGGLIVDAIKASPFRIVNGVVSLAAGETEKKEATEIVLEFAPGDPTPPPSSGEKIASVLERIQSGENLTITIGHELGGGDIARALIRANPPGEDCRDLITQLRRKRTELLDRRAAAATEARAAYSAGLWNEIPDRSNRLRALDRELGLTEVALDQLYDFLRIGADRQAVRRGRETSLAIARARLAAVKWMFAESGLPGVDETVRALRPSVNEATGDAGGTVTIRVAVKK